MALRNYNAFLRSAKEAFGLSHREAQVMYGAVRDRLGRSPIGKDVERHPRIAAQEATRAPRTVAALKGWETRRAAASAAPAPAPAPVSSKAGVGGAGAGRAGAGGTGAGGFEAFPVAGSIPSGRSIESWDDWEALDWDEGYDDYEFDSSADYAMAGEQ